MTATNVKATQGDVGIVRSRLERRSRRAPWLLLLPALAVSGIFFGIPALYMLRMSFNLHAGQNFYIVGFSFENYVNLLTNPVFTGAIATTIKLSLISSIFSVLIGYGFALLVWARPAKWRMWFIGLALCPLLVSEISIIFGWTLFFPHNGLLSFALLQTGIISSRVSLMYTELAALVGLIYITLPFCFFIMLSIFDGIDKRLCEASGDLGAGLVTTLVEILLPLTRTGILVAFAQSFIWAMGIYATPSALGPDTLWTVGYLVQDQMLGKHNWPMAAALAMVLIACVSVIMAVTRSLMSRRDTFHV